MITGTQIRPFTLYSLDPMGYAARCCFESQTTKIICTLKGPDYSGKILNNTIQVKIQGYQTTPSLIYLLERVLLSSIVLQNYEKASFVYQLQVLEYCSNIFSQLMSILCYTTCYSQVPIKDMFVGVVVALVGNDIFIDPTSSQFKAAQVKLMLGYLPSKKKMIHWEVEGKTNKLIIQKMLGLGLNGCNTINNFIEQKIAAL